LTWGVCHIFGCLSIFHEDRGRFCVILDCYFFIDSFTFWWTLEIRFFCFFFNIIHEFCRVLQCLKNLLKIIWFIASIIGFICWILYFIIILMIIVLINFLGYTWNLPNPTTFKEWFIVFFTLKFWFVVFLMFLFCFHGIEVLIGFLIIFLFLRWIVFDYFVIFVITFLFFSITDHLIQKLKGTFFLPFLIHSTILILILLIVIIRFFTLDLFSHSPNIFLIPCLIKMIPLPILIALHLFLFPLPFFHSLLIQKPTDDFFHILNVPWF